MPPVTFSEAKAARVERFFGNLKLTQGEFYGKPFELQKWNRPVVHDVYGTLNERGYRLVRVAYIEIAKKNAKTNFGAGAALYQTFADGERNGEVYSCASDRSQASLAFDIAVDMVDQVPALKKRAKLNLSQKMITDRITGTFYKALSADVKSKHGLNPSAVVADEIHAWPNRDLWDVVKFGAGAARRQPIWWVLTTAGDDPDRVSIGWELHDYALRVLGGDIVDPTWYAVIYTYDGDDIYNEANWHKANPALGVTISIESVREEAVGAKNKAADERLFRWLRLNQWLTSKLTTWLPIDLFNNTLGKWDRAALRGKECYAGLDLSSTGDLSAFCLVFPPQKGQPDWRVIWWCWIPEANMRERIRRDKVPYDVWAAKGWVTPTEGDWIDYNNIEAVILQANRDYFIKTLVYDPASAAMLIQRLMSGGIDCMPLPQKYEHLNGPMVALENFLRKGEMTHEDNPVARWCFGNTAISVNGQGLIKFVKEHRGGSVIRTKRIDLLAAWVDALAKAMLHEVELYETRGLLTL